MENQKLLSLLNDANDSKFPKRKLEIFMIIQKRIMMQ